MLIFRSEFFFEVSLFSKWSISKLLIYRRKLFSEWAYFRSELIFEANGFDVTYLSKWAFFKVSLYSNWSTSKLLILRSELFLTQPIFEVIDFEITYLSRWAFFEVGLFRRDRFRTKIDSFVQVGFFESKPFVEVVDFEVTHFPKWCF